MFVGSGLLLACYLGQFKAYENRFIHITQADWGGICCWLCRSSQSFTECVLWLYFKPALEKIKLLKRMFALLGQPLSPNAHRREGNKHWAEKGEQWEGGRQHMCESPRVLQNYPFQRRMSPSFFRIKKVKEKWWQNVHKNAIFDFWFWRMRTQMGHLHHIKWNKREEKSGDPPLPPASF